jgi:hypothetical protein
MLFVQIRVSIAFLPHCDGASDAQFFRVKCDVVCGLVTVHTDVHPSHEVEIIHVVIVHVWLQL